jgi:CHASE2 domain-containing sensor protein
MPNLMTQVFLSHAEEDGALMEQLRRLLLRRGITVWTSHTDIQTGDVFEAAIQRGIEQADTIVCLVSPAAVRSRYCQQEVDYALSLNKRIIPLLLEAIDLEQILPQVRSFAAAVQFIDFTDNRSDADYRQDVDQLIKVLHQEASYYEEHKILLSKALKWERQSRNPSILLRGYNLRHAEDWLKRAKQRTQHLPTPLQELFITESLQQPPAVSLDVFISYSRADSDLARRLNDELQTRGKTTWFDQESIASGADFQQEIYRGIESADNFLFILSPRSVNSPYCADEVEYAAKLNKRIVTLLHQAVNVAELHPELAKVQWIDFDPRNGDFYANFNHLVRTLDTDLEYLRSHTRLTGRALEWERAGQDPSFLLRGTDLVMSEQWLTRAIEQTPPPTNQQIQYIRSSRNAPLRQATPRSIGLISLASTVLVLGLRLTGIFQPLELTIFDQFLRLRPHEPPDPRFLIVEITEDDIQTMLQRREKGRSATLSDESLSRLLKTLDRYQPRLIGLDLYRDFKVDPSVPALNTQLSQDQRFFSVCKLPDINEKRTVVQNGTVSPLGVPLSQVGFSDIYPDPGDVIRRQVVRVVPRPSYRCQATQGFGFLLAHRYLEQEAGNLLVYKDPVLSHGVLQLGSVVFPRLGSSDGGYQNISASGFQLLLNYRAPGGDPGQIADRVSLGDILSDRVSPQQAEAWKHRIVLIGVTSQVSNEKDYVVTPYGRLPGVVLQAQMASQILSAVLDGRPLLRALPLAAALPWIWFSSLIGGLVVYYLRSPLRLMLVGSAALSGLVVVSAASLILGHVWMPLIPSILVFLLTTGVTLYITAQFHPVQDKGRRGV